MQLLGERKMQKNILFIFIAFFSGLLGGFSGNIIFQKIHPPSPPIAVVDVKKILLDHQEELARVYPAKDLTDSDRQKIIQDARVFASSLGHILTEMGEGKTLLVKDAVIGDASDLTKEINDRINIEMDLTKRPTTASINTEIKERKGK